ncbi:hypothetical protein SNEBB_005653 [Seison nebaliae]|nr:hypothetical protein SNEBB_005653 [Seison nebaliae]
MDRLWRKRRIRSGSNDLASDQEDHIPPKVPLVIEPPLNNEDQADNNSPVNDIPANDNPADDNPPAENPADDNPPAENPPAENPPAENPPAENPPAEIPPAENPPAENPPAIEVPANANPPENQAINVQALINFRPNRRNYNNLGRVLTPGITLGTFNHYMQNNIAQTLLNDIRVPLNQIEMREIIGQPQEDVDVDEPRRMRKNGEWTA